MCFITTFIIRYHLLPSFTEINYKIFHKEKIQGRAISYNFLVIYKYLLNHRLSNGDIHLWQPSMLF